MSRHTIESNDGSLYLLIEESVYYGSALLVSVEQKTDEHYEGEYDEVVESLDLIRVECAEDHKEAGCYRKTGEYESLYGM